MERGKTKLNIYIASYQFLSIIAEINYFYRSIAANERGMVGSVDEDELYFVGFYVSLYKFLKIWIMLT